MGRFACTGSGSGSGSGRAGQGRAGPRRLPQAGPPVNVGRRPDRGQLLGPVSPAAAALPLPFGFFFLFTEF